METTYSSKMDAWIVFVVGLSALVLMATAVSFWMQPINWGTRLMLSGLFAIQSLVTVDLLLRTNYRLNDSQLHIRCGLLRWRVPYATIQSVRTGRTWVSGPALSLDRLIVSCSDRVLPMIISPVDQRRFLEDLADRDAGLMLQNGGLVRLESNESTSRDVR